MDANNMNVRAVEAMEKTLRTIERIAETFETVGEKSTLEALKRIVNLEEVKEVEHYKLDKITKKFETVNAIGKTMQAIEENTRATPAPMLWLSDKIRKDEMVKVFARISVVAIGDIDPVEQKFNCEFYLSLRWEDDKLKDVIKRGDEIKWAENCWEPAIVFTDIESMEIYERHEIMPEGDDSQVIFYYHIKGTFRVQMNIQCFPFDYQKFTVTMTSHWDDSQIEFIMEKGTDRPIWNYIRTWNFVAEKEWDIQKYVLTEKAIVSPEFCDSNKDDKSRCTSKTFFPLYKFKIYARRKYGFFLYNIALTMALITALTFSVYTVGADNPGDRIQISLTLLLTSVALKYVVNEYIPQTPTPTVLGSYILASMVFQFAMAVQNGISVNSFIKPRALKMFELWSFAILLVLFITIQGVFLLYWFKYAKTSREKMQDNAEKYKQRMEMVGKKYINTPEFLEQETQDHVCFEEHLPLSAPKFSRKKNCLMSGFQNSCLYLIVQEYNHIWFIVQVPRNLHELA
eukprot:gene20541-22562_t